MFDIWTTNPLTRTELAERIRQLDTGGTAEQLGQALRSVVGPHIGQLVPEEVVWAVEDIDPLRAMSATELADKICDRFGLDR